MSDNKKYYYLKLKDNFFDREEIKVIKGMDKGDTYVCIMLEMYLRSLKRDGKLMMTDRIPFNPQTLSSVLARHVDEIKYAIDVFKEFGLIEILDTGAIYMSDVQNFIGHASSESERKALYRNRIKEEKTLLGHCPGHRPPEIEIEREIINAPQIENLDDVNEKYFETIWKEYTLVYLKKQNRRGGKKHIAKEKFLKLIKKYSIQEIKALVVNEYKLALGSRDLERVFTMESMKQFMEDRSVA